MPAPGARRVVEFTMFAVVAVLMSPLTAGAQGTPVLPPPAPESAGPPAPTPQAQPPAPAQQENSDQVDVLTRGPVHEAFAEQYNADPVEGLMVPKAPPEPVNEVPPKTMPEGNNVQWIPGYWGWDDDREDFIWISGLWRDIPPGQRWIPGYWHKVDGGYQWVSGFWTGADVAELDYLPQPPASLEQGPNIDAPGDNQFWVPGAWNYVEGSYRWRPGYWAPAFDDWVWIPDRFVWTPFGYVYCPGYWDYRLPVRGVLFAPVYFAHVPWWHVHPFVPGYVLDVGPLTLHWFVRPAYCHYYFGDFYASRYYVGWGLQPWHTCVFGFGGFGGWRGGWCYYDPLLVFYTGYHRRHHRIDFRDRLGRWHKHYRDNEHDRPRWTAREQDEFLSRRERDARDSRERDFVRNARLGRKLDDYAANPADRDQKFVSLDDRQRDRHSKVARETVELAHLRRDVEGAGSPGGESVRRGDNDRIGEDRGRRLRAGSGGDSATLDLGGGRSRDTGEAARGGEGGTDSRRSRGFKLPEGQGAGDQLAIPSGGDGGRRGRRGVAPSGPPTAGDTTDASGAGNRRGGRSQSQTGDGGGGPNSNRGRSRNESEHEQSSGSQARGRQSFDGGGGSVQGDDGRTRRQREATETGPDFGSQGRRFDAGPGDSGGPSSGHGGKPSGGGAHNRGSSGFQTQPFPGPQDPPTGGGSSHGPSRSRSGSGSGGRSSSSSDFGPPQPGIGGRSQSQRGGGSGGSAQFHSGGSQRSGSFNSGPGQRSGGGSGSFSSGGSNRSSGSMGSGHSGGRNSGGRSSGGGHSGGGRSSRN